MTQPTDTSEPAEVSPNTEAATAAKGLITGPRVAAGVLLIAAMLMFLFLRRVTYFELAFAVALLIAARDARLTWVRYALLAFMAYGLVMGGMASSQTGDWVNFVAMLAYSGGLAGLTFIEDDLPKVAVLAIVALAGLFSIFFV